MKTKEPTIKQALKKQKREILEELSYFKYPSQVKRSKEWLKGYDYCREGVKETIEEVRKQPNSLKYKKIGNRWF